MFIVRIIERFSFFKDVGHRKQVTGNNLTKSVLPEIPMKKENVSTDPQTPFSRNRCRRAVNGEPLSLSATKKAIAESASGKVSDLTG